MPVATLVLSIIAFTISFYAVAEEAAIDSDSTNIIERQSVSPTTEKASELKRSLRIGLSADVFAYRTADESSSSQTNLTTVAPILSYNFSPKTYVATKFNFASGGSEQTAAGDDHQGSTTVEYAYLDHQFSKQLHVRIGNILLPIGIVNPQPESVFYYGVSKPEVETALIPTPWHENGIMFWNDNANGIRWRLAAVNSLDASGFRSDSFIKGGRQNGQNAKTQDIAGIARIDWLKDNMTVGASCFYGETAQDNSQIDRLPITLWETHFQLRSDSLELRGLYTEGFNYDAISLAEGPHAELANGYYLTLAADLIAISNNFDWIKSESRLFMFVRQSEYNLHARVPKVHTADPTLDKTRTTVGFNYYPQQEIVFKANYQFRKNAQANETDVFEIGLGVLF